MFLPIGDDPWASTRRGGDEEQCSCRTFLQKVFRLRDLGEGEVRVWRGERIGCIGWKRWRRERRMGLFLYPHENLVSPPFSEHIDMPSPLLHPHIDMLWSNFGQSTIVYRYAPHQAYRYASRRNFGQKTLIYRYALRWEQRHIDMLTAERDQKKVDTILAITFSYELRLSRFKLRWIRN